MATGQSKAGPVFLILFLVFSFGTGIILVTASQQNTEGRSKAAYNSPMISPTQAACRYRIGSKCFSTAQQYTNERNKDWRCKAVYARYNLCTVPPADQL